MEGMFEGIKNSEKPGINNPRKIYSHHKNTLIYHEIYTDVLGGTSLTITVFFIKRI